MFGNFIYFILVLLIYSTYQPSAETNFTGPETLFLFVILIVIFTLFTWIQFRRIEKRILKQRSFHLDNKFTTTLTRQSILAIVLFSIDVYGLNLTSFLTNISLLTVIPTFQALLFLLLFIFYLAIVWACAYGAYQALYRTDMSRKSYVLSQISFSVPNTSAPGSCFPGSQISSMPCPLNFQNASCQPPEERRPISLFSFWQLPF